jgi:hypothetical protein
MQSEFMQTLECEQRAISRPIELDFPIRGDFEDLKELVYAKPSVILILGKKDSGKTGLGLNLLETSTAKTSKEAYVIQYKKPFPSWIKQSPFIENIPNDSEVFCDESWLTLSSLAGISTNRKRQLVLGILATAFHQNLYFKFVVQNSFLIDVNVIRMCDALFIKEPSIFQVETERQGIDKFIKKAREMFDKIPKEERKEYSYVVSDDFEGMVKNKLPSFWNSQIRNSFRRE